MNVRLAVVCVVFGLSACGGGSSPAMTGELICNDVDAGGDDDASCLTDGPTYETVQPIFAKTCMPCHDGTSADGVWPLTDYDDIAAWSNLIKMDVLNCSMPPSDGGIPITDHERGVVLDWILCGAPLEPPEKPSTAAASRP